MRVKKRTNKQQVSHNRAMNQSRMCSAASKRNPNLHHLTKLDFIFFTYKKSEGGNCWCWISCSTVLLQTEVLYRCGFHLMTVTSLSQDALIVPIEYPILRQLKWTVKMITSAVFLCFGWERKLYPDHITEGICLYPITKAVSYVYP